MIRLAPHYIEEPPEGEPPFGYCPRCEYALVDAHECRCGWQEYEAIDDGAATARGGSTTGSPTAGVSQSRSANPETRAHAAGTNPASPCFAATSRDAAGIRHD